MCFWRFGRLFLSTLSLRRATHGRYSLRHSAQFLSTLSLRRATHYDNYNLHCVEISIHALLAESDFLKNNIFIHHSLFLSTLSLRRATHGRYSLRHSAQFLSTLSLRRATSLCMLYDTSSLIFLSTLSLRRATRPTRCRRPSHRHFYPRSPCGERRGSLYSNAISMSISIHALLAESDFCHFFMLPSISRFLSTLSLRRATILGNPCAGCPAISIHALLAESDQYWATRARAAHHFYPRSPCGERQADSVSHWTAI